MSQAAPQEKFLEEQFPEEGQEEYPEEGQEYDEEYPEEAEDPSAQEPSDPAAMGAPTPGAGGMPPQKPTSGMNDASGKPNGIAQKGVPGLGAPQKKSAFPPPPEDDDPDSTDDEPDYDELVNHKPFKPRGKQIIGPNGRPVQDHQVPHESHTDALQSLAQVLDHGWTPNHTHSLGHLAIFGMAWLGRVGGFL